MKGKLSKRLSEAITKFFNSLPKNPPISESDAAAAFIKSENELVEEWTLAQITLKFRREIALSKPPSAEPYQMLLFGFPGGLEEWMPVKAGRIRLGEATIKQLRENVSAIRKRAKTRLYPVIEERKRKRLIEDMALYARTRHGLTIAKYCELKAAGVRPDKPTRKRKHSLRQKGATA